MSIQLQFGSDGCSAALAIAALGEAERRGGPISGGAFVASLAGGLRSAYGADPEADLPDAFAELIARLREADDRAA